MSKYTIQLRELFEPIIYNPPLYDYDEIKSWFTAYELSDYLTEEQIEVINNNNIWNKDKLAEKIINHYYMYEIGFETPSLFKHQVITKMREIMGYYLPIIYSNNIKYDPLVNVDYTETLDRTLGNVSSGTGTGTSSSTSKSDNLSIGSDTPQNRVTRQNILNGIYASSTNYHDNNINDSTETNSTSSTTSDSEEAYTKRVKGNSGVSATAQKMVEQYRDNILNTDLDIINELRDLFMLLY